jgi:hypothetical protein
MVTWWFIVVHPVPQEVQIHGEVNLKKHVQRLVAASKYRDVPKTQRPVQLHRNDRCCSA